MRSLFFLNLIVFTLLILLGSLIPPFDTPLRIFHSFIGLAATLLLPACNLTFLFHLFIQPLRSLFAYLTLASVFGLILPPLLLTLESSLLGWLFPSLPLWNSFGSFILLLGVYTLTKKYLKIEKKITTLPLGATHFRHFFAEKAFFFALTFFLVIVTAFTTSYYALPDLDPYYWLEKYRTEFSDHTLTPLFGYRPLFASLTYIFTIGAHIDAYAFFKYVLPLLPLLLIFPITFIAHRLHDPLERLIIILSLSVNAVTLTYLELPIPQSLSIILSLYAAYFLILSFETKNKLFYWLGGWVLGIGYFFHEMMVIPFLIWILVSLVYYRRNIFAYIHNHRVSSSLIIVLLLPHLQTPLLFVWLNLKKLFFGILSFQPNWLFPSHYVNIDGNQMGWGDFLGVTKYYLYYAGPEFFLLAGLLLYLMARKKFPFKLVTGNIEFVVAGCIFLVFFLIAEALPRLFSIALLPERAWIIAGIFFLPLLLIVFRTSFPYKKMVYWMFIMAFSANAAGAVYINNSKKYLITEGQMQSAQWIKASLPQDRILYTFENNRLLRFYSGSLVRDIKDPNFYYNETVFEKELHATELQREKIIDKTRADITHVRKQLKELESFSEKNNHEDTITTLKKHIATLQKTASALESTTNREPETGSLFIYYAAPDPRNPYLNRPYYSKFIGQEEKIFFDRYPEKFQRVYSDPENNIFIWQIL